MPVHCSYTSWGCRLYSLYWTMLQQTNALMFNSIKSTFIYVFTIHNSRLKALYKVSTLHYWKENVKRKILEKEGKKRPRGKHKFWERVK